MVGVTQVFAGDLSLRLPTKEDRQSGRPVMKENERDSCELCKTITRDRVRNVRTSYPRFC